MTMSSNSATERLRKRLTKQSEDALGRLAQDLIENPLVNSAITRAFDAREKAGQAQELAMSALNIPSAADVERLTRRLRAVSQRLEGVEETLDRIEQGVERVDRKLRELAEEAEVGDYLDRVEERLEALIRDIASVREAVGAGVTTEA
jgi:septal ring factor EnvC (AmiA/AmiB activator)